MDNISQDVFGQNGKVGYLQAHYDITRFCQGNIDMLYSNMFTRLRNAVAEGMNGQHLLPRAIILVMDSDLIEAIGHNKPGFSFMVGRLIEWLANQLHRMITAYKEKLPSKSRKFEYPTVLWCNLPTHYDYLILNEFRDKCNLAIKGTVSLFREMEYLEIKWDDVDRSYFTRGYLNAKGLASLLDRSKRGIQKMGQK